MPIAGAVLVGGRSRRMGRDKALLEIDDRPMAVVAIDALGEAGCDPVVIVGGDHRHRQLGVSQVPDLEAGAGPLVAIVTALTHLVGSTSIGPTAVAVLSCDLPDIDASTITALADRWAELDAGPDGVDVVVARTDRRQPMCAVWSAGSLTRLEAVVAAGERAVHRALDRLAVAEVAVEPGRLRDLDTPSDIVRRNASRHGSDDG